MLALADQGVAHAQSCASDCNGSGDVTVDELVRAVNIALGGSSLDACPVADLNGDGSVSVNELIGAVNAALGGCAPVSPPPTLTATATSPSGGSPTPTATRTPPTTPGGAPNALDESFDADGLAAPKVGLGRTYIAGLVNAPGGGVYFTGDLTAATQFNGYAARLTAAGALDASFNAMGVRPVDVWTCSGGGISPLNESMYEIAVDGNGRVLIAGSTTVNGGTQRFALARFTDTGSLDASFGSNGCATIDANPAYPNQYVSSLALQPDGRILLAGWTWSEDWSQAAATVVRLTENGALDEAFASGGRFQLDGYPGNKTLGGLQTERVGVALQSDGRIVVAHTVLLPGPSVAFGLTRLDRDGDLDAGFGDGGSFVRQAVSGRFNFVSDLVVVAGDRIVVGGSARNAKNKYDYALMRTSADGTFDESFGAGGVALLSLGAVDADDFLGDLAVDSEGRIVAAGVRYAISETPSARLGLARFDADGNLDAAGFCPAGTAGPGLIANVRTLVDAQNHILVSYVDPALGNPNSEVVGIGVLRYRGGAGTGVCGG
ncbi:MAG: hypothetical protein ABI629_08125 [bacterium]